LLEAMKMEIPVEAPVTGIVAEIFVQVGQRGGEGERLLVML
jgi:biotin carboxyl carrier protein